MQSQKSFKSKLLSYMLLFNLISISVVVIYAASFLKKRDEISSLVDKIYVLNANILKSIRIQTDFINYDATDTLFHKSGSSKNLELNRGVSNMIQTVFVTIQNDQYLSDLHISDQMDTLKTIIDRMNVDFEKLVYNIQLRGFKDYGVEGEMRLYAHKLEETGVNRSLVLSLRRHEKDYIIRKEDQYISKLNNLGLEFIELINSKGNNGSPYKDSLTKFMSIYLTQFNKLVKIEEEIGLYHDAGLIQNLNNYIKQAEGTIDRIVILSELKKDFLFRRLEVIAICFLLLLAVLNAVIGIYLSKLITDPIKLLTEYITKLTKSNFDLVEYPKNFNQDIEINILVNEFNAMLKQLLMREKERDMAEEALRENEVKFRNLADLLPQSVFEADINCNLTYYNKTFRATFGFDEEELGKKIKIYDILGTECDSLLFDSETSGTDYFALRKNGDKFPVLLYVNKITQNEKVTGFRGIIVDITEKIRYTEELKKQISRAEQADKLKSAFLANMSHEIRTPMNSIVGFSQILTFPDIDEHTRLEYAEYIRNSSDLLLKIINDILDIAKIESGQFKISYSFFDLNILMNNIGVQAYEIKKSRKKDYLKIRTINFYEHSVFIINSDQHRIEQVLINLVSNAIKFTQTGTIEIGYSVSDKNKLEFFVKDTGIGIPSDKLDFVFERFTQIEETNSKLHEGTGIGLSICKSIVELLGGRIWVESVPDYGSVFRFELPLMEKASKSFEEPGYPKYPIDYSCFRDKKLLIAEDVDFNYLFLKEGLKPLGMEILRAVNGEETLKMVTEISGINVILMDMRMPLMDGYEATRRIKSINNRIKIIATTANAITGDKEKCMEAGCDFYISKPIKLELLINTIGSYHISNHEMVMPS